MPTDLLALKDDATPAQWAVPVLLVAPAAMLFILLLRPIWDVDIFWQLRLGELILHKGGPVMREPFSAPHLGEALAPIAWLGQAAYAKVRLLIGWTGLRIFDAIVWLGGFWAVAAACRRRGASSLAVALAIAIAFASALPNASIRPQSFAVLGFGLLLTLLRLELPPAVTLLLALPLFVLWQNLHPSVTVAVVVLGATASLAWMRRPARYRSSRPWLLTMLTLLSAASVFATPAGVSILGISAENARISAAMGVSEWLPVWSPPNRTLAVQFVAAALAAGWLLVRNHRRIDLEELIPVLVLFVMSAAAYRFVLFWSVALVPVLARALSAPEPPPRSSWRALLILASGMAAAVGLALLSSPTHFSEAIPIAGIRKLRESRVTGTIYDHFQWGGPLIDAGYPNWVVAYDGRFYRYSPAEWRRYYQTTSGEVGPAELDRIYHPAAYLLKPGYDTALIAALRAAPAAWRRVYADAVCVVYVRIRP